MRLTNRRAAARTATTMMNTATVALADPSGSPDTSAGAGLACAREARSAAAPRARRRQHGFTLIEVMVVIAILGILAALIVPKIMSRPDQARQVAARQDITTIMQALKLYRLDNGRYPTQEQGLRSLIEKPGVDPVPSNWKDGGYLERLPNDPWGARYQYLNPGAHGEIDVFSYGADNKPGGEGNDADIGSWQQ